MKRIIVLGATGQLGGEVTRFFCQKGYSVIAVGHRVSDNGFFDTIGAKYIGGFDLEDFETFKKLPCNVDAVVHLAGSMPAHVGISPMPYVQSIIVGMINVCEWMKTCGVKRIIFNTTPSDIAQYFGSATPVPENAARSFPQDGGDHAVYAISKNAAVDLLTYYQEAYGFLPCIFRHLTVYGWHPDAYYFQNGERKILPYRQIIRKCIKAEPVEIWGEPTRKKELLYIKDFVRAVFLAVNSNVCGLVNLPGYRPYTLEEQIDGFINGFAPGKVKSDKKYFPEKTNTPQNLLALGKAKADLHWVAEWDWESACRDMRHEMEVQPFATLWGGNSIEDSY